jgi:regulator of protease activity HflC (stomatin/prohibitin superfamily)
MRNYTPLIVVGVIAAVLLVISLILFDIETIAGNEYGVKETWSEGVVEEYLLPKTYILFPGFTQKIYHYDASSRVFVMNDQDGAVEYGEGRRRDSYMVQSAEGQDMRISLNVRWRIDPEKVIQLHKTVRENIEEKILRPELMRVVKDEATLRTAIEAYSGVGLVQLQSDILARLSDRTNELGLRGVIVENFVIESIGLDPEYVGEIKARQVAIQREMRAREETKAALAEAEKVKAEAQAEFEKFVVEGKRDKEVGILMAQKQAEQEVLAAEASKKQVVLAAEAAAQQVELAAGADKKRVVLAAEGEKEAGELKAQAIIAIGKAEAQATELKLRAYTAAGPDAFVQIEVAKYMAEAFKNIDGYLPQDMKVNLLSESFMDAVKQVVRPGSPSSN